jgi:integrase
MRRHAPDGREHPPTAYGFGDETGGRVKSVKRAWESCVLRAHGYQPKWVKGKPGRPLPELRAELRRINLHFHDLRRQFACKLLESSAGLHDVSEFLGHAKITTTSRYLGIVAVASGARPVRDGRAGADSQTIRTRGLTSRTAHPEPTR